MDSKTIPKAELLGLKVMKASALIEDAAHGLFKQHGLSAPQYNVLRILRGAVDSGLRCQEISVRMVKRVPDITRLLDRLEDKSLVARHRSEDDRRVVMTTLTPDGKSLLKSIDPGLRKQVSGNFTHLTPEDFQNLDAILERLITGLNDPSTTAP